MKLESIPDTFVLLSSPSSANSSRFLALIERTHEYTENTRSCIITSTGHDRLLYLCSTQELGLRSTGSVSNTPTRPCFAHRPDYSSVFTYGLGLTQYNCSGNIRMISGYRTLAYRASHNIIVLNCS